MTIIVSRQKKNKKKTIIELLKVSLVLIATLYIYVNLQFSSRHNHGLLLQGSDDNEAKKEEVTSSSSSSSRWISATTKVERGSLVDQLKEFRHGVDGSGGTGHDGNSITNTRNNIDIIHPNYYNSTSSSSSFTTRTSQRQQQQSTKQKQKPEKLQIILDKIYIQTNHTYDGNLWDVSNYIPQWMKGTYWTFTSFVSFFFVSLIISVLSLCWLVVLVDWLVQIAIVNFIF